MTSTLIITYDPKTQQVGIRGTGGQLDEMGGLGLCLAAMNALMAMESQKRSMLVGQGNNSGASPGPKLVTPPSQPSASVSKAVCPSCGYSICAVCGAPHSPEVETFGSIETDH